MINDQAEVAVDNERSLMTLSRAIQFSEGQFSLVFARCNYSALREQILARLQELCPGKIIRKLDLPSTTQTLYTTVKAKLGDEQPSALIVSGLESVVALDNLLASTNQVRDEFRKQLPFPLVLWVNDQVLKKLVRLAPDFSSWAATPIKFVIPTNELLDRLFLETNNLFSIALDSHVDRLPHDSTIELRGQRRLELEFALQDLQSRGVRLEPELDASIQFIFGKDDYANDRIDLAITRYRNSLIFWRNSNNLERQGVLLYKLGICYCRNADRFPADSSRHLDEAWPYLQQCIEVFEEAGRPDLVAQFITQLEEVLQRQKAWPALQTLAQKSALLHETYGIRLQLALDYGFLAKVALLDSRWEDAFSNSSKALSILTESNELACQPYSLYNSLIKQLYRLILVKSQRYLGQMQAAADNLEQCAQELESVYQLDPHRWLELHLDPHRYLRILVQLQSLYFELGRYQEAFRIKQERHSVEQRYGLRAFLGANQLQPELVAINPALAADVETPNLASLQGTVPSAIAASGRQQDVNSLLERISRPDYKLIVIHGKSGVGKSSLVTAGLVPTLHTTPIGDQIALPVVLRVYRDWVGVLGRQLIEALREIKYVQVPDILDSAEAILEQFRKNENRHLLTVLIFDQLEEFFLIDYQLEQKREFYDFFQKCLNFPSLKVILSIKNNNLHNLLELGKFADLEKFNIGILNDTVLYPLGNFSAIDAKAVIKNLTERASFYLENALIDQLVKDLADEQGEVLPIELQVVGAQLQSENITTLQQYQQKGPKQKLAERYLEKAIADCGPDNQDAAAAALCGLTDEKGNRPLKTKAELADALGDKAEGLDLILEILVDSGLVFLVPEVPANRYQLVHDYLVTFIRKEQLDGPRQQLVDFRNREAQNQTEIKQLRQEKELLAEIADARQQFFQNYLEIIPTHHTKSNLLVELEEARQREELSQFVIEKLHTDKELLVQLAEAKENQKKSEQRRKKYFKALAVSVATGFVFIVLAVSAIFEKRQIEINTIRVLSVSSEALFASHKDIDALKRSVKAGIKLKQVPWLDTDTQTDVVTALQQVVYGVREQNRLEGHTAGVYSVSISPDGQLIASASADNTIKFWLPDGSLVRTLQGHRDRVSTVSFSPDGQLLASGSWDNTVKLWGLDGTLLKTLPGHSDIVLGVSFSPDGQTIASASADKTVKIWGRDGTLLKTLKGHQAPVQSVSFSPDGQTIATASADKTVKLWGLDGTLLKTLEGHTAEVTSVSFSPDGRLIATGSADKTIKLWKSEGTLLRTLSGHTELVNSVSFSPDSRTLASASFDKTIKLWQVDDGKLLTTLEGHSNWVSNVSFSPDGKTLVSASRDKTIRIWRLDNTFLNTLKGHNGAVNAVSFSHDGQTVASASDDNTVKLWHLDTRTGIGVLLQTLRGHAGAVNSVRFSPDGQTIASASTDTTVKLWHYDGTLLKTLKGHSKGVLGVSFSPDGQLIATASKDKTVRIWKSDGTLLYTLTKHTQPVNWVSFSPDSQIIASASDDHTVNLWSRDGVLLHTLNKHKDAVWGVSFSPDGQTIASASLDNTIKLWSRDGKLLKTLTGNKDGVTSVSFSQNGQLLASGSLDNTVKLWKPDGTLLKTIQGQGDGVTSVSFSPDSQTVAVGITDGRVILWKLADLNLDSLLVRGCDWLHDYLLSNRSLDESNEQSLGLFSHPPSDRDLCNDVKAQK